MAGAGRAELASIYADAEHYDLLAQMTAPADVPFYEELLARHGGPLLELGCGTARVLLELCRGVQSSGAQSSGAQFWGIDAAPPLLEMGRAKLSAAGLTATLLEADFRDFDLERTFRLLLFPYNAFNHLYEIDDVLRCLATLKRHMDARSLLVIDTFNPDPSGLAVVPRAPRDILRYLDPTSGEQIVVSEANLYDAGRQINHVTWTHRVHGRQVRVDELDMRIFFPRELDALMRWGGLEVVSKLGNYDGTAFSSHMPKQLMLCRLPGSGPLTGASGSDEGAELAAR